MKGVGLVSVTHYAKQWDYAVVAILFIVAALATLPLTTSSPAPRERMAYGRVRAWLIALLMLLVTLAILPARDQPYEFADPYHEGENLSPASVMMAGGHPYRDVWFMHGFATDGGLDLLVMGDPPSIVATRRMHAILSAATVSLLVPIAFEVSATTTGAIAGVIFSLCGIAAGQLPATPHFRFLPLLLAVWLALRKRPVIACAIASAGLLCSLDIGLFAVAGIWLWLIVMRPFPLRTVAASAAATVATPLILLVAIRGDISRFFRDSFLRLPECFDAIYSLPAPRFAFEWASMRYYAPPIIYGIVAGIAWKKRSNAMMLLALTAFVEFRTASGRYSWGHNRFAVPLLGIIVVAFLIEPLIRSRRTIVTGIVLAVLAVPYFEVIANAKTLGGFYATYRERLHPKPGTVPFPNLRAHDLFTYPQEAHDAGELYKFSQSMPAGPIFDYSGEKYLYYMLARPASTRVHDIPYLSDPALGSEAMKQLQRRRPVFVVVGGHPSLANIDGISNAQRTPEIAAWIDRNYARRITIGRYTVGLP